MESDPSICQTTCLDLVSMSMQAYRARTRSRKSDSTRARITAAVRELMSEGSFHQATMEQVADRAGVSRATLYQHFGSRLDLVDAICETFSQNPALSELRELVVDPDPGRALDSTIANSVRFWASEDSVLSQIYGVAAIDPAAQSLVDRQRADRRGELERLVRNLSTAGRLRPNPRRALPLLLLLTSYETFRELRAAGLSERQITATLQETARELLAET
jgi:AcrR family transcriptional regulator